MLSVGKMVGGAEEYYLSLVAQGRDEYYTGAGEAPGNWMGSGAADLGLSGEVTPEALRAILAGTSPASGDQLGHFRRSGNRVAGFDLTFSAPKSVSLLYALGSPEQAAPARAAHDQAVAEGLAYLERHAVVARRGTDGLRQITTSGLVAAGFVHRTSRNGDPQLHTHVLAANVVHGADDRWSAPDARGLYFHARTAGFVYQASLRASLVESLGVSFGPVRNGAADLAGMDATVLRRFSTRRVEIENYLSEFGGSSKRSAELAALATRAPKTARTDPAPDAAELRAQWRQLATEHGIDLDHLFPAFGPPRKVALGTAETRELAALLLGPAGLTAQDSSFERRDVVRAVAERALDGAHFDAIEAAVDVTMSLPEAVSLERMGRGEVLHTTSELLAVEANLLETAVTQRGSEAGGAAVTPAVADRLLARRPELSEEQRAMVRSLVTSGQGTQVVVGKAGAGKTTALSMTREIFEEAGWQVSGTALSARAAAELESSAGIPSVTLTRLMGELDHGSLIFGPRDVVVVDEAGMVGTRTLARLVEVSHESGASLVLVGDPRQLPEIQAGGAFGTLATRLGALELTENRRQHELWEREALDQLRSGDVALALSAYDDHGRIRLSGSMTEARRDLVGRWLSARGSGEDALMLAVNRRDVAALNLEARDILQRRDQVGVDLVTVGGRAFALGDEVLCLRNARRLGVLNGTLGTVAGIDGTDLAIDTADGPRSLPHRYVAAGHLDYGYATTVHKAQGATYDRAFVLATESLTREAGYVAMSRARLGTELFVPDGSFERGLGPEAPEIEPLARTATRLTVSRAKVLASSHLGESLAWGAEGPAISERDRTPADRSQFGRSRADRVREIDIGEGRRFDSSALGHGGPVARDVGGRDFGAGAFGGVNFSTDFSGPEPAVHIVAALGSRPAFVDEQAHYDQLTHVINDYRTHHDVEGDDPLGPRPFETFPRLAYDAVAADIRSYEGRRWRAPEPPERDLGTGR
jgi:conjugative relaxase-like TrwC/TraI family protein